MSETVKAKRKMKKKTIKNKNLPRGAHEMQPQISSCVLKKEYGSPKIFIKLK
jgi:hypothetical protein